ncbi:receptor-like protein 2 [Pyrus ussuriensis x Pyrus communis]|uniref:Receptor-like protein 2 n=1 Tax=Pyrus ussuriensis x Pyrus communis TaxID=2448454 RepID=A0A5N5FM29_9ROSA|nr:receptor-like protein 2 [Pyrus ussuriensis x Pyrus communis]
MLLHFNNLEGPLPPSLMNCTNLIELNLESNHLDGNISELDFSKLDQLIKLDLGSNYFSGVMPKSLYSCKLTNVTGALHILMRFDSLRVVMLPHNFIGEELPDGDAMIGSGFQNLRLFGLSDCQLKGHIPVWILNNNSLSGGLPKELFSLQALVSEKPAAQTDSGDVELPINTQRTNASVTALQYNYVSKLPRAIYIRNNSLSGNIPVEIGQLQNLHELDLSVNNIVGSIPDQVSNLTNLERLDLSRNHLSGGIPASLSNLHFLASLSIQGFDATAFEGNPGLCATKNMEDVHGNGNEIPWFYISVALGFIVGFWGVCGSLALITSWRYAYFQFLSDVKDRFIC